LTFRFWSTSGQQVTWNRDDFTSILSILELFFLESKAGTHQTNGYGQRLTHFRQSQLHWLDAVDQVRFRVCVQVFRCLHKMAPEYLSTYCQPVSGISGCRHLRSADRGHLDFPHVKLASYGGHSFAYAGPSNWNSLPAYLKDSSLSLSSFKHHLKTFLFSFY